MTRAATPAGRPRGSNQSVGEDPGDRVGAIQGTAIGHGWAVRIAERDPDGRTGGPRAPIVSSDRDSRRRAKLPVARRRTERAACRPERPGQHQLSLTRSSRPPVTGRSAYCRWRADPSSRRWSSAQIAHDGPGSSQSSPGHWPGYMIRVAWAPVRRVRCRRISGSGSVSASGSRS